MKKANSSKTAVFLAIRPPLVVAVLCLLACKPNKYASIDEGEDETATPPANITGVYMACEYTKKAAATSTLSTIGCRLSNVKDGRKVKRSEYEDEWEWSYKMRSQSHEVVVREATKEEPWHAYYDILPQANQQGSLESDLQVGLKHKNSRKSTLKPFGDTTGQLKMLLRGNWEQTACIQNKFVQEYAKNFLVNWEDQQRRVAKYYAASDCSGTPDWEEVFEFTIDVINFDGKTFDVNSKLGKWTIIPRNDTGLAKAKMFCSSQTFSYGVTTDVTSCSPYTTFYTITAYEESDTSGRLFMGAPTTRGEGATAETRVKTLDTAAPYTKIPFDDPSKDEFVGADGVKYPYCIDSSASTDPDGDHWGWENNRTCRVKSAVEGITIGQLFEGLYPYCGKDAIDLDGDGWGWELFGSCKMR